MRLATWNINNINKRLPLLLAWLDATKPDVVALQELKATTNDFPRAAIEAAGYGCVVVGERTWNGVGLLARDAEPVLVRQALPGNPSDRQARYVEAAVNGLLVASLYLPNGNPWPGPKFDYKMAWFERLLLHAKALCETGHPVALLGDFNVVPTDADIYSPKTWLDNALLQPEPRNAFKRLLKQGWTDAIRTLHPKVPHYTFWDYRRNRWQRDAGLRIDQLLLSKPLKTRFAGCRCRQGIAQRRRSQRSRSGLGRAAMMCSQPVYPHTPDGRYFVVRGRLWRLANPALPRALRAALTAGPRLRPPRWPSASAVPVWWTDGAPDYGRLVTNTPYATWFAAAETKPSA